MGPLRGKPGSLCNCTVGRGRLLDGRWWEGFSGTFRSWAEAARCSRKVLLRAGPPTAGEPGGGYRADARGKTLRNSRLQNDDHQHGERYECLTCRQKAESTRVLRCG